MYITMCTVWSKQTYVLICLIIWSKLTFMKPPLSFFPKSQPIISRSSANRWHRPLHFSGWLLQSCLHMQHSSLHRWDVCWGHGMQQQLAQNDRLGGRVAARALGPTAGKCLFKRFSMFYPFEGVWNLQNSRVATIATGVMKSPLCLFWDHHPSADSVRGMRRVVLPSSLPSMPKGFWVSSSSGNVEGQL